MTSYLCARLAALVCLLGLSSVGCTSQREAEPQASAATAAASSPACPPIGNLNFVCGMTAPEDLVLVPGTRWLIASGMAAGSGLRLVDTQARTSQAVMAGARADGTRYANCPGPLDAAEAVLHGLSLRPRAAGGYTLYATNHGGRESVEVFDVDSSGAIPSFTWVGCVLMPDMLEANSVAAFGDGALVATVLMLPGRTFEDLFAGRNTGAVFMWTPGSSGFQMLAGTELAGNNGIDTSADDREFYVASSGQKRIVVYSRANPTAAPRFAQLTGFAPDNVRLIGDRLVTAGMLDDEPACGGAPKKPEDIQCPRGYVAVGVDPRTLAVTEIARGPAAAPYGGTAMAVPVGNDLWLSSFNADRVAWRTLR